MMSPCGLHQQGVKTLSTVLILKDWGQPFLTIPNAHTHRTHLHIEIHTGYTQEHTTCTQTYKHGVPLKTFH